MCSRCCKVTAHLYHSGKSSSSSPWHLAPPPTFKSRLQLSLLSVCVRRKDSLSHKGELLLSTSNLDTHPLLFLADSHRPCQKSIHCCCHCYILQGSLKKCEKYVHRMSLCPFLGSVLTFLQKFCY